MTFNFSDSFETFDVTRCVKPNLLFRKSMKNNIEPILR